CPAARRRYAKSHPRVWMTDPCGADPARSRAAAPRPSRAGVAGLAGFAGPSRGRFGSLPVHLRVLALPGPFEGAGDEGLDPLQAFVVGGFGAGRQRAGAGVQGAPAPAQVEGPVGVGPFDVLDVRARLRPAWVAVGFVVDAGGVLAELDEVPAGLAGRVAG